MVVTAVVCLLNGCESENVDLGGTSMPAASSLSYEDAGAVVDLCAPCDISEVCGSGSECGVLTSDSNTYCGTSCPVGDECEDDERCQMVITAENEVKPVCVPSSGSCGVAPPLVVDGMEVDQCGPLSGPTVEANCSSCRQREDCQQNGCYAGQWCDTRNQTCYDPPSSCP